MAPTKLAKNKETDKLEPPKKTTFIDDQIAWANSFNDPKNLKKLNKIWRVEVHLNILIKNNFQI